MGVITGALANAPSLSSLLPTAARSNEAPASCSFAWNESSQLCCSPRTWVLCSGFSRVPSGEIGYLRSRTVLRGSEDRKQDSRGGQVRAKGKGFGELLQKKRNGGSDVEKPEEALDCPCGGGEDGREYGVCCARYHGGVIEPDATTLMRARFSAYARSKVDYVVRTTHPDNPDFQGEKELAADVRATCQRLRFTKLEILDSESATEEEAFVSFRVTYSLAKGGRGGDRKYLVEKSRFLKEGDRWLYRERIPLTQASEAAWQASNYFDPEQARKSFSKTKPQANQSPRKS